MRIKEFIDEILDVTWDGGSLDGQEMQELMLKCGIIKQVAYDPKKHGNSEYAEYCEPGDPWFEVSDEYHTFTET